MTNQPLKRWAIRSLAFAATVAVVVAMLKAANWLPTVIEDGLVRPYATVEDARQTLHLREIYVPSYFPQRLAWPPARILAQSKPHVALVMEFKDRERGEIALTISQSERAPLYVDKKLEITKVTETVPYRLKGRSTVLAVGVCGETDTCSRLAWTEGTLRIEAVMRSSPAELLRIADSMID
jgi:hypothetical protein